MKHQNRTWPIYILLVIMLASIVISCSATNNSTKNQPQVGKAKFEESALLVTPRWLFAGDKATVSAVVRNTGDAEGIYKAVLTVDGVKSGEQDISIPSGAIKEVTFAVNGKNDGSSNPGSFTCSLPVPTQNQVYDPVTKTTPAASVSRPSENLPVPVTLVMPAVSDNSTVQPQAQSQAVNIPSDWRTYNNYEYGFSIMHPSVWQSQPVSAPVIYQAIGGHQGPFLRVCVTNTENLKQEVERQPGSIGNNFIWGDVPVTTLLSDGRTQGRLYRLSYGVLAGCVNSAVPYKVLVLAVDLPDNKVFMVWCSENAYMYNEDNVKAMLLTLKFKNP